MPVLRKMPARAKKRAKAGYMISAVAELYKLHPQTLRLYERVGLLKPSRSQGNTRLYTDSDLERLDVILTLARHGREPGGHRNYFEHARENDRDGAPDGRVRAGGAAGVVACCGVLYAGENAADSDCAGDATDRAV